MNHERGRSEALRRLAPLVDEIGADAEQEGLGTDDSYPSQWIQD